MFNYSIPGRNAGKTVVYQFGGLDRQARIADGACRDMQNCSTDDYPCLTPRAGRVKVDTYTSATALMFKRGKPFVIDGTAAKYGEETVGTVTAGEKQLVTMNDWIFLWPDKAGYNVATGEWRSMEEHVGPLAVHFTKSSIQRKDGQGWPFAVGDGVTISGAVHEYNNRTAVVQAVRGDTLVFYDNVFHYADITAPDTDHTTEDGDDIKDEPEEWDEAALRLDRTVPDLSYVCEKDNRLWGVYDQHICCCKLGDGFNWNVFNGLATDAYDVGVGSDGEFTGIIGYSSYVMAFKEHCVHKLQGSKPTNFTANVSYVEGVQTGAAGTMAVYNNVLYYLSRLGVVAFTGGTPESIGAPLACEYTSAVGGCAGGKYYLSGVDADTGKAEIVVYDTGNGAWAREDSTRVLAFGSDRGRLYYVDDAGGFWRCGEDGERVRWYATFGPFEDPGADKKIASRLDLVLTAADDALVAVDIRTDHRFGETGWRRAWQGKARRADGTLNIPHLPVRGHEFEIRISGEGFATLRGINRVLREGSAR